MSNPTIKNIRELEEPLETLGYDFGFTRRSFVQILGAGLLIFAAAETGFSQPAPEEGRRGRGGGGGGFGGGPVKISARLHIATDGTITVLSGKVEGGQGARTEITQAAAEELGVPASQINLILADTELCPDDGPTVGSRTTPSTIPSVRQGCAAAKKLFDDFASQSPAGKKLTYADLASDANFIEAAKQNIPRNVIVSAVSEWKILGTPLARPNAHDVVVGKHKYPSDQVLPGMLYGKVLRPASFGATLTDIDLAPAKAIDGVIVARDGQFVGVAAPNSFLAQRAITALEGTAQWDSPSHPSSKTLSDYLRKNARNIPANPFADAIASAAKKLTATYEVPYVQHAPLEPRAALADWKDGKLTVWTATQNPTGVRRELAGAFHIAESNIRVIVPDFGGGFGGKHTGECAVEAARIAQAAQKPVLLRWTRPEEFTWAYFRAAAVIDLTATLDENGAITSWFTTDINYGTPGIESPYNIASKHSEFIESKPPLRHGSYRALAATANNFARESFMDELALAAGKNPLEFRRAHLNNDRLLAVLNEAAKQFDFSARRAKSDSKKIGVGIACATEKGSYVAACVEVEIAADQTIRVNHICQAFECGAIMNPSNLEAQVQGALMQGIGPALREATAFENGKITNASFFDYEVPRFAELPMMDIHLLNRPDLPSAGAGETPLIALAPAINNAVFHATGKRVRQMPIRLS
ncbi:MAG TPA: molybdopterin cofactor-binding domain-containing protein [Tepidisphaeraceae bacterium]|jgi:isoquinoline 1-oxidoreductase|nr:molybdopterin cofactor-binding domain-containing protein [Tepidisphaeraceae bacterium]